MRLAWGLFWGYYHPSRDYGCSPLGAALNAVRLTVWCLQDKRRRGE